MKDVFFHIPGFQPLLENGSIHGDVSQKPIMRNSAETGFDVTLENPLRIWFGQCIETLFNRIGIPTAFSSQMVVPTVINS